MAAHYEKKIKKSGSVPKKKKKITKRLNIFPQRQNISAGLSWKELATLRMFN
jgi:hypothetical protein